MIYAASICVSLTNREARETSVTHCPLVIEAASYNEAVGKASRMVERMYPRASGYANHHVIVAETDAPIADPESVEIIYPPTQ